MKSVYVVLSQTGTLFSRAIFLFTKDPYNHASISFDNNLKEMYSFGRKRRHNILNNGFIIENFKKGLFPFFPKARCCILEICVSIDEYEIMKKLIYEFLTHKQIYRYNLIGLIGNGIGMKFSRKNHFFCSQFVSYILNNSEIWDQDPELTRPMDFYRISSKRLLFEGHIKEYLTQSY